MKLSPTKMFNGKHIFFISGGGFAAGNKAL
jgi:hypothetical protein